MLETSTFQNDKMEIFKSNESFCNFYLNLLKKFLYTQNKQEQSPNLKRVLFKYLKCKFSNHIDHSVIFIQLFPKLYSYSKRASEHLLNTQNGKYQVKYIVLYLLK